MALSASDLKFYSSLNMPESGNASGGGGIDVTSRVVFDNATLANTLNERVKAVSSLAADVGILTIHGRDAGGVIQTDPITLNGTTMVSGAVTFERLLKIVYANAHSGNIFVSGVTSLSGLATLESGVNTIRRPFYNVAADQSGGSTRNYYDKVFLKNTSLSNALLDAFIIEGSDPSGKVTFALGSGVNDTTLVANRETAPTGVTAFDSNPKGAPGTVLNTGQAIATWLNLTLSAGDSPAKTTYTFQASGTTT